MMMPNKHLPRSKHSSEFQYQINHSRTNRLSYRDLSPPQMNETLINSLITQANHELFAAQSYSAMAYWCEANDYNGFGDFFRQQATEEREHADRFFALLSDLDLPLSVTAMDAPRDSFSGLSDLASHALSLEQGNTSGIIRCYEQAVETKAYRCQPTLLEFIDEQVEEESWASTMVNLTKRCECPGAALNLDRHIGKLLGEGG